MATIAVAVLLCIALILVTAYLLITYHPPTYHPRTLSKDEQQIAEQRITLKAQHFYNNIHEMVPFNITFDTQILNELFLLDDTRNFINRSFSQSNPQIHNIQVNLSNNEIILLGTLRYKGVKLVLSISLVPKQTTNHQWYIYLGTVKIGALPLPKYFMGHELQIICEALKQEAEKYTMNDEENRNNSSRKELTKNSLLWAADFFQQQKIRIDSEFQATEDEDKLAFIKNIRIFDEQIALAIEPAGNKEKSKVSTEDIK